MKPDREPFLQSPVFKLVVLLSLLLGGYLIKTQIEKTETTSIRLGYSFFGSITEIDPIEIQTIYQSNIIENLYSRLVEYDNAGQIICSLCTSFSVDNNIVRFDFAKISQTIDGKSVGALDAQISLQRIASSQTNTHGSLSFYLDPKSPIQSQGNQLSITVLKSEWVPFVLSLLTSMDFSIIPQDSIDKAKNRIADYRNTSGLYFVDSSDEKGRLKLKANIHHLQYRNEIIGEIIFVPTKSGQARDLFAFKSIDMIDPTYYAYAADIEQILKIVPDADIHKTVQIGLTSLVFSKGVMGKTSNLERVAAAIEIKKWFLAKTDAIFGAEETHQYFQSFGQGFITPEQQQALQDMTTQTQGSSHKFIFGLTEKYRAWAEGYKFPNFIEVRFYKSYPGFLPEKDRPDIYFMTADSSFDEDISALSYLFSQGIFSHGKDDGAAWIKDYMNLPGREQRIDRLRELHFEVLRSVKVYPVLSRPYIAISTSEFRINFPKIYAGSPMWKVWKR